MRRSTAAGEAGRCLVQRMSYKAVAAELGISIATMRSHIRTGSNPLPGGDQNLNVIVAALGSVGTANNANRGARWVANSDQSVTVAFPRPVRMSDINLVTLVGQVNGANSWTIEALRVRARREGGGPETVLVNQTGAPLHRFTASARNYTANRR